MKRILALGLLLIALTFCFAGCSKKNASLELKNRLIIQGIGIDREDGELSISVQALNTDVSSNSAASGAPEEVVKYYTVTGTSISEAINSLSDMTGNDPLVSQNRIVVFGREFAESGISEYLDDFVRSTENRTTVYVALADEKAKDIIFAELGENIIPARRAEQIIRSSDFNSNVVGTRVYELLNMLSDETASAVLPVLRVTKENDTDMIEVYSTAIIKDDTLLSEKDETVATGILWANDRIDRGEISFDTEDGTNVTANIIKSSTRVSTEIRDGKPVFNIKIKCYLDISEVNRNVFKIMTLEEIENIDVCAEKAIKNYVENSINECIMRESADVFGFGRRLKRTSPKYFKLNASNWNETMKNAEYNTQVDIKIERLGGSVARLYD